MATLPAQAKQALPTNTPSLVQAVFLPSVFNNAPWQSPFGIETNTGNINNPTVNAKAQQLGARWLRLNTVSWRTVQPAQNAAYNWSALAVFEQELAAAQTLGMTPMVIVDDSPSWATINAPFQTSCGAIRADRFADFAAFMKALVARYPQVRYWELGNEPDVDPTIVTVDNVFGCWGKISDPYYGGEHYGNMLKAVAPEIRTANPSAKILVGGLLLANPTTTNVSEGKPEKFLEGILRVGAANSFDILPFHAYPSYPNYRNDYDASNSSWNSLGGWTRGKAKYLRDILATYGIYKTIFLNETGLLCTYLYATCQPAPTPEFFEAQADHVVRMMTRAMFERIENITWYTLEGPGWGWAGLLDENQNPRPVYGAYQTLISHITSAYLPPTSISYGVGIEAYRFNKGNQLLDVMWASNAITYTITVPATEFLAAYDRNGSVVIATPSGTQMQLPVGFSGLYVYRKP